MQNTRSMLDYTQTNQICAYTGVYFTLVSMNTLQEIPEFKQLFAAARKYIAGELSICELNGHIGYLKALVRIGASAMPVQELLTEWETMVNRRWNEWGLEKYPLTEDSFAAWLKEQLVFDGEVANNSFQRTPDDAAEF